jgi:hypothetical protein
MAWVKRWSVASHTDPHTKYTVALKDDGTFGCTCGAWKFQRKKLPDGHCKHINALIAVEPVKVKAGKIQMQAEKKHVVRHSTSDWMIDALDVDEAKIVYVPLASWNDYDDRE